MMALPFITEGTGFKGKVYATEPTLQIGRYISLIRSFVTVFSTHDFVLDFF